MEKQHLTEPRSAARLVDAGEDHAGMRLDRFLCEALPHMPKTHVFRLVRKGEVRVNGKRAEVSLRLQAGDKVRIPPVRLEVASPAEAATVGQGGERSRRVPPRLVEQMKAAVLLDDPRLLVVNKPSGVAVHGGSGVSFGVIEALRAAYPERELELVHRLDRETSGILLVAQKRSTLRTLHALLREHAFEKRYLALVVGSWDLGKKRIDARLRTDIRVSGERTVKAHDSGKEAVSDFRPVQFFSNRASLLEVAIRTGRTHQIRVHAAYAGHPVAGDEKYGNEVANDELAKFGLKRMFLHASSVSFTWPESGTEFSVNAPLPEDLAGVLDALGSAKGSSRPRGARPRRPR